MLWTFLFVLELLPASATEPPFTSENFVVTSLSGQLSAERIARHCESMRVELSRVWCPNKLEAWNPRCKIVVHDSRRSYLQTVGQGGAQTFGSSLIQVQHGKTLSRRIDLLLDENGDLQAMPHELTHVVMSDRFNGRQPPLWFDEGAAMLADTLHKRGLHARDCREALALGSALPLSIVLSLDQFASAKQVAAFYGQSASLTQFLCDRGGMEKVISFAIDSQQIGYAQSLQQHYRIASVDELERQWKRTVFNEDVNQVAINMLQVKFKP